MIWKCKKIKRGYVLLKTKLKNLEELRKILFQDYHMNKPISLCMVLF